MKLKLIFSSFLLLLFTLGFSQISFIEKAVPLGINVNYGTAQYGGGVSFIDFDNDGWDDLTFGSQDGDPVRFFKNSNSLYTEIFPLSTLDPNSETRQVVWADYDNDGDKDLFVASLNASNKLYRNEGSFTFIDVTVSAGFDTAVLYTDGASWGDYNNDGYLDIFLSSRDPAQIIPNKLYKNNGDGTFTDVSIAAGIKTSDGDLSFCASFFDYNKDGWQDIYVANDKVNNANTLYKNNGNGTFTDVSISSGTGIAIDAMSTTISDYNNDGWFDIYVTNTDAGNQLLKNNGDGTFTNVAISSGIAFYSVAWGAVFLDADNDLDLDLYVSGMLDGSNPTQLPSAFYENNGSHIFSIPSNAGFANDNATSFSNAIGDINNDGYPEIAVVNFSPRNMFLFENNCPSTNNWLKIGLEGTSSNRDGIGSTIELTTGVNTYYRYTLAGEGYQSQNSNYEFFGLKDITIIDEIKIKWLSGVEDVLTNVNVNQTLNITEGSNLDTQNIYNNILSVYPNPSHNGIFKLSFKNNLLIETHLTLEVYNLNGQIITSTFINGLDDFTLNLSHINSGIYFIKLYSEHFSFYKKAVKLN